MPTTKKPTKPSSKKESGKQKTVGGMNEHNIQEMKDKLAAERRVPTSGMNEQARTAHDDKLRRMERDIEEAERRLRSG